MTLIEMLHKVYGDHTVWTEAQLLRLKELERLVRADEREACAKLCDEESSSLGGVAEGPFVTDFGKHTHMSMAAGAQNCAAAIRARGETKCTN
jgi:hypothetical protein